MQNQVIHEVLDNLAEKFIPEGIHESLHVDSREMWIDLMVTLIEARAIIAKPSILTK